ncbi:hypothetical protein F5880DRAFT_1555452 [Lentinula raphanica]|nr:hypothetical protein F5880DRAFT_1555452 [Lentinula raphanica]
MLSFGVICCCAFTATELCICLYSTVHLHLKPPRPLLAQSTYDIARLHSSPFHFDRMLSPNAAMFILCLLNMVGTAPILEMTFLPDFANLDVLGQPVQRRVGLPN